LEGVNVIDVEVRTIQKDLNKTNVPCQMAKPHEFILELEEAAIEAAYKDSVEFKALYDYAKFEESRCSK
jgi:hypothetical protein